MQIFVAKFNIPIIIFLFLVFTLSLFPFHHCQPCTHRDPNSDQGWGGNTTPNQSLSFRILQKITDTIDMLDKEADLYSGAEAQAQAPQFARQMDVNEQQLRRMQLNEQDKAFINRNEGKCVATKERITNEKSFYKSPWAFAELFVFSAIS